MIPDYLDLRHCDNMELMAEYPDKHFDLAIVDPPYGIGYSDLVGSKKESDGWKKRKGHQWDNAVPDKEYFEELLRVSNNQIVWGGNYFSLPPSRCFLVWDKVQRIDQADAELAWTSFNSSVRIFDYARGNESGFAPKSVESDKPFANLHPTQKPVQLYKWLLKNYAKEGDKILDTHLGSMSIAIAVHEMNKVEKMNLTLTGCELDEDYYKQAMKRVENACLQMSLL